MDFENSIIASHKKLKALSLHTPTVTSLNFLAQLPPPFLRLLGRRKEMSAAGAAVKRKQFGGLQWERDRYGTAVPCPQGELYLHKTTQTKRRKHYK